MMRRNRITIKGMVQGVGFRPFIFRKAIELNLTGFVKNSMEGVVIEIEGKRIEDFIHSILSQPPSLSKIREYKIEDIQPGYSTAFEIRESELLGPVDLTVSPDIAICAQCLKECSSPTNRRYQYPFINCTDCGPRFSIIKDLPYDRPGTTMHPFIMCPLCKSEYTHSSDRRFHAQPISCFDCGPELRFYDNQGHLLLNPIAGVMEALKKDYTVAVKGIGGYHLVCRANSDRALQRLRLLKKRESKPFALMATLEMIEEDCFVSPLERDLLMSAAAPILLLSKRDGSPISEYVAPHLNRVGFMLPYTSLHHMILKTMNEPLVVTSANYSDEPIIYNDDLNRLSRLADFILSHNRSIHFFADDSVLQVAGDRPYFIRRSRGFVPLPLSIPFSTSQTVLGLGALQKTTFTFLQGTRALVSQYIGTTDSLRSMEAEKMLIAGFAKLFSLSPDTLAVDKHPSYPHRLLAADFPKCQVVEIQHHKAHVASLLAEQKELTPIIGLAMDGTGFGDDGKIWGGEFFAGNIFNLQRVGHLKNLFLPSGDQAVNEPWRFALAVLHHLYGDSPAAVKFAQRFKSKGGQLLETIAAKIGGIETSSCGRLFDAAAVLLGIGDLSRYDGELPSKMQVLAESAAPSQDSYNFSLESEGEMTVLNFLPAIHDLLQDRRGVPERSRVFHQTVARAFVKMADHIRGISGFNRVGLTGGVFQNVLLLNMTQQMLHANDFKVVLHSKVPANDGGISLGQACLAAVNTGG